MTKFRYSGYPKESCRSRREAATMVRLNLLDGYSDSGATGAKIKVHSRTLGHGGVIVLD